MSGRNRRPLAPAHKRAGRVHVLGSCYVCGGPCTRNDATRVKDATVGVRRLVHRVGCRDRFEVQAGPKIEGGDAVE